MTRDLDTPLAIALGVVESTRAQYMDGQRLHTK